ncbi:MAG: helix-turn-helix domain-containing protein, partial [Xenococcaceae cyanobacterium]
MLLNYQYRAYPDNNQKNELNYWRRLAQYWYNWQLGDRFQWWEQSRNEVLPVGIWLSDYIHNIKAYKAPEKIKQTCLASKRKIPTIHKESSALYCQLSCSLPPRELKKKPGYYSQKKLLPHKKKDLIKVSYSGELLDFTRPPSQTLQDVSKQ